MAKYKTFKEFERTWMAYRGDGKFALSVNRCTSWTNKRTGEKWYFAMDHSNGFGWDGLAAYRADTDELYTLDGMADPLGREADDELPASYGSTRDDCEDAMMGA